MTLPSATSSASCASTARPRRRPAHCSTVTATTASADELMLAARAVVELAAALDEELERLHARDLLADVELPLLFRPRRPRGGRDRR